MIEFYIDLLDANGNQLGSGPITSASDWQSTARMDKAGDFSFRMPASDAKATLIQPKRRVRCMARLAMGWTEIGNGIVDSIVAQPGEDGITTLTVSGQDILYELAGYSAGYASIANAGDAIPLRSGLDILRDIAINEYSSPWIFSYSQTSQNPGVYALLQGESLLAAVGLLAAGRYNFRLGGWRQLDFFQQWQPSGIRAIRATGDLAPETCAIVSLQRTTETHELLTRISPFGSGQGRARLTLRSSNRSIPPGYTGNLLQNWLQHTPAANEFGRIDRWVEFKGIGPIANTDLDIQAAANALFDAAVAHLDLYSQRATHYGLTLAQCNRRLLPGQTIRVYYRDTDAGLTIDEDLYIIEATISVDSRGLRTTSCVVSDQARWPVTDAEIVANRLTEGKVFQAHPQLNANSYTTSYTKHIDDTETAAIRFFFGNEVTQLQQVLLTFQLLPFESTVKAVGGATSGSGSIPTGGPSTNESGSGGNNETGAGGSGETSSAGAATTSSAGAATTSSAGGGNTGSGGGGDTGSGGPTSTGSGGPTSTGSTSGSTGSGGSGSTGSTGGSTGSGGGGSTGSGGGGSTGSSGGQETTGPDTNETGGAIGGDWASGGSGRHAHGIGISPNISGASLVYFDGGGFAVAGVSTTIPTNVVDNHTHTLRDHKHDMANHTHSIDSHTHSIDSHTHSIGGHTHTIAAHTHTIGGHTHTVAAHTHTMAAHTHSIAAHSHTVAAHTHTVAAHTHTIAAHTHTIAAHTHSLSAHTHSLNNHTHDLSESLTAIYGIFRESAGNTYAIGDLEYRVNGGSWANLNTATSLGGGWYRLDVTSQVQNSTTFRPLQEQNTLEIRRRAAAASGKTVTVDALLSVRNIIQAIAYV